MAIRVLIVIGFKEALMYNVCITQKLINTFLKRRHISWSFQDQVLFAERVIGGIEGDQHPIIIGFPSSAFCRRAAILLACA